MHATLSLHANFWFHDCTPADAKASIPILMMKHISTQMLFGAAMLLPLFIQAQVQRSAILSDAEYAAAGRYGAVQPATLLSETQRLQNTVNVLHQSFSDHCKARRIPTASAEGDLLRALADLQGDVTHLSNDVQSHCGKAGRVDQPHLYRTFLMVEYAAQNAESMANRAGYMRSLTAYFTDIDEHVGQLTRAGMRNPNLKPIIIDGHLHAPGRETTAPNQAFPLPPVPRYATPTVPTAPAPVQSKPKEEKIDLKDILGRLLKDKLR